MTQTAIMDKNNSILAVGFDDQTETLDWVAEQIRDGVFTEEEIEFKDNIFMLTGITNEIKVLYDRIFGGSRRVFFKDYVTNDTIVINEELATRPFGDRYSQTFFSMLNFLQNPYPKYLVIYKI